MAEQVVIVCDVCGAPATSTVTVSVQGGARAGQKFTKDLCDTHLAEIVRGGRKPRRGRRRATVAATEAAAPKAAPKPRRRARAATAPTSTAPRRKARRAKAATA